MAKRCPHCGYVQPPRSRKPPPRVWTAEERAALHAEMRAAVQWARGTPGPETENMPPGLPEEKQALYPMQRPDGTRYRFIEVGYGGWDARFEEARAHPPEGRWYSPIFRRYLTNAEAAGRNLAGKKAQENTLVAAQQQKENPDAAR